MMIDIASVVVVEVPLQVLEKFEVNFFSFYFLHKGLPFLYFLSVFRWNFYQEFLMLMTLETLPGVPWGRSKVQGDYLGFPGIS